MEQSILLIDDAPDVSEMVHSHLIREVEGFFYEKITKIQDHMIISLYSSN